MKIRLARTVLIVVALLALAGGNVFASPVACVSGGSLQSYIALTTTGCTVGDKTFSNFADWFTEGQFSGNQTAPGTPNDANIVVTPVTNPSDIGLNFNVLGTVNGVAYDQLLTMDIDYTVTVGTGFDITSVYTQAWGGLISGQSGASVLAEKNLCLGGSFVINLTAATNLCTGGTLVTNVVGQNQFLLSGTWASLYSGTIQLASGQTILGVDDRISLNGGTVNNGGNTAGIASMANEFLQSPTGTPEPATCLLLGSALLGFGALRRKRV
jgi:hypothetical protein